jgi:hypothetical protein
MTTCNCDNPPGGSVTCGDGQIPVCRVVNGAAHGYCLSPPSEVSGLELTAWFFSHLLRREVTTGEVMARLDLQVAVVEGRFTNTENGETITFRVPENMNMAILTVVGAGT